MKYNPDIHHRRSIRLKGYDYSQGGACFITICMHNRECVFGDVEEIKIELSSIGEIAKKFWMEIPNHFNHLELDEFIVMLNHVHGIIILQLQQHKFQHIIPNSIGSTIRSYKGAVIHWCKNNGHDYFRWQRNYYEHVIRNEDELNQIRKYIAENPLKWERDEENPINIKSTTKRQ